MSSHEVHVSVPKFFQHFGQDLEKFFVGHVVGQSVAVSAVDFVPIETVFLILIVEEAVFGVDDTPKCLKITLGGVLLDTFGDAGW